MRRVTLRLFALIVAACAGLSLGLAGFSGQSVPPREAPRTMGNVTLFEGARLIFGDGRSPLENSALLIENNKFTRIGKRGAFQVPNGAVRVDVMGRTIMPALVDLHGHPGYQKDLGYATQNYTRENLIDHLQRYAYYGIGTIVGLGTDVGDLAFELRELQAVGKLGGAQLHTAGRGLAAPHGGSGNLAMKDAAYGIENEEQARRDVQELASEKVDFVKIYVDDRNGSVTKLRPELYRAIIDEAHKHRLHVVAHVFALADAKDLVRAGIDGFSHLPRDREADSELVTLVKQHNVFVIPSLLLQEANTLATRPSWIDEPALRETVSPVALNQLSTVLARRDAATLETARVAYHNVQIGLMKMVVAGARVGFGSDSPGIHFIGYSEQRELELMVAAGMTPAQVIVAATHTSADILGLERVGTIAPGNSADFIVLDANPLDDIANSRRIENVYLLGKEVDRRALRASWNSGP